GDFEFDECILFELDSLGFPRDSTVDSLMAGRRNHATTAYNLLSAKRYREEQPLCSIAPEFRIPPRVFEVKVEEPSLWSRKFAITRVGQALVSPRWQGKAPPPTEEFRLRSGVEDAGKPPVQALSLTHLTSDKGEGDEEDNPADGGDDRSRP
ncbi:hypothetical protein FOZ62_031666, partial [Perkinsus olseni]